MTPLPLPNSRCKKRRIRFSLRTALILVTLLCVALGWWVVRAERQRDAIEAVRQAGGRARYTYEVDSNDNWLDKPQPWTPAWLRKTFGEDLFITVDGVYFEGPKIDDEAIARLVPKLQRISNLRWLELRDSSISDAALNHISKLTQLERLLIRASEHESARPPQITDAGLAQAHTLRGLRLMSLADCKLDGSAFGDLNSLGQLEELDLRDTGFNDAAAQHLLHFPHLKSLNLWNTAITDSAMREIAQLENLEELYLSDNMTDTSVTAITKLKHLKILDLGDSRISKEGMDSLQSLLQLQELRHKSRPVP